MSLSNDGDLEQNQLQESQRSMQKKQKVYEEMADKQLSDIISTMMSVSDVLEPENEEAEERSSFAASERSSMAEFRKDSDLLVVETFASEVQRLLSKQSNESDGSKLSVNSTEEQRSLCSSEEGRSRAITHKAINKDSSLLTLVTQPCDESINSAHQSARR